MLDPSCQSTRTFLRSIFSTESAISLVRFGTFCVFEYTVAPVTLPVASLRTSATQQAGPMGLWPLCGYAKDIETTFAAEANALSTLPTSAVTRAGVRPAASDLR